MGTSVDPLGRGVIGASPIGFRGCFCGTLLTESWYENLGLVSDDAPHFKLFGFVHGLCWVHGERKIARLKAYRETPTPAEREVIETEFDQLCSTKTQYPELNDALGKLGSKRDPFLKVLEHPHLPLYNNLSENDIREYARLRKISSGTRSDQGQRCRDTFLSLKKTCRYLEEFADGLFGRLHNIDPGPARET